MSYNRKFMPFGRPQLEQKPKVEPQKPINILKLELRKYDTLENYLNMCLKPQQSVYFVNAESKFKDNTNIFNKLLNEHKLIKEDVEGYTQNIFDEKIKLEKELKLVDCYIESLKIYGITECLNEIISEFRSKQQNPNHNKKSIKEIINDKINMLCELINNSTEILTQEELKFNNETALKKSKEQIKNILTNYIQNLKDIFDSFDSKISICSRYEPNFNNLDPKRQVTIVIDCLLNSNRNNQLGNHIIQNVQQYVRRQPLNKNKNESFNRDLRISQMIYRPYNSYKFIEQKVEKPKKLISIQFMALPKKVNEKTKYIFKIGVYSDGKNEPLKLKTKIFDVDIEGNPNKQQYVNYMNVFSDVHVEPDGTLKWKDCGHEYLNQQAVQAAVQAAVPQEGLNYIEPIDINGQLINNDDINKQKTYLSLSIPLKNNDSNTDYIPNFEDIDVILNTFENNNDVENIYPIGRLNLFKQINNLYLFEFKSLVNNDVDKIPINYYMTINNKTEHNIAEDDLFYIISQNRLRDIYYVDDENKFKKYSSVEPYIQQLFNVKYGYKIIEDKVVPLNFEKMQIAKSKFQQGGILNDTYKFRIEIIKELMDELTDFRGYQKSLYILIKQGQNNELDTCSFKTKILGMLRNINNKFNDLELQYTQGDDQDERYIIIKKNNIPFAKLYCYRTIKDSKNGPITCFVSDGFLYDLDNKNKICPIQLSFVESSTNKIKQYYNYFNNSI